MASKPATTTKPTIGIGRVLLWSGGSLWIGRSTGKATPHAHHAIQISLALTGRVALRSDANGAWTPYTGAIVLPHRQHQFDGTGETVAQIFVEPETAQGRALLQRHSGDAIHALPAEPLATLVAPLRTAYANGATDAELVATAQRLLTQLVGAEPAPLSVDPRITRAISHVREHLANPITLAQAAAAVHLSPSRFRHLFVAQTGMSLRAYLLWARVEAAVGAAMAGMPWTEAAHAWGFADSAHLSRTCRRMFGLAPTMLLREPQT